MPYGLIVFDCDGVVVDSEPLSTAVMAEMAGEQGLRLDPDEALQRFKGRNVEQCVSEIAAALNKTLPDGFIPEFRQRSAEQFRTSLAPVAGIASVLENLPAPYCLASNGPLAKIRLMLTITGLNRYFKENIFSGYELGSWKPDPDLFLQAARYYSVPPDLCAVIEDSDAGVQAGLAANMNVFRYNPHPGIDSAERGKVVTFDSMYNLIGLLGLQDMPFSNA